MHGIFISYSRVQAREAGAVAAALEDRGLQVWMDQADIPLGVPWERQIRRAIRESDLVAYFVSDTWLTSDACANERAITREYGKAIVAVNVVGEKFTVDSAVDDVARAYLALDAKAATLTDLEVASATWAQAESNRSHLASGAPLKLYRRLVKTGCHATATATEFVAASIRRNHLRRFDIALGALVLAAGIFMAYALPQMLEVSTESRTRFAQHANDSAAVRYAAEQGPYSALAEALKIPTDDDRAMGGLYVSTLQAVVSANVPVDRGPADARRMADFSFSTQASDRTPDESLVTQLSEDRRRVTIASAGKGDRGLLTVVVPGRATSLRFSPDGTILAVLTTEAVSLIDPLRGRIWRTLNGAELAQANSLSWSSDGRQLAVRESVDGLVDIWQVLSETKILAQTGLWIMDSTLIEPTGQIAFLARDGSLALVDPAGSVQVIHGAYPSGVAVRVASGPAGTSLFATAGLGGPNGGLHRYDIEAGRSYRVSLPDGCYPIPVATSPAYGGRVVVGCGSRLVVLDMDGSVVADVMTDIGHISAIAMSRDGKVVAGSTGSGGVVPFDQDLQPERVYGMDVVGSSQVVGFRPGATPWKIRVSPDGRNIYATGDGTGFQLGARALTADGPDAWSLGTPPVMSKDGHQSRGLAISPDGVWAAIGLSDGSVQILEAWTGAIGWRWHEQYGEVRGIEFAADSKTLVIGTRDGLITSVPIMADRVNGLRLRTIAQEMLDRARRLDLYTG